jgi:hypothetical protein
MTPSSGSGTGTPLAPPVAPAGTGIGQCTGKYAYAWQFSLYFCAGNTLKRVDNGGGVGVAVLTDTQANFQNAGIQANKGMILYNLTTGVSGPVIAVTATTLTASSVTWSNGDIYRVTALTGAEIASIDMYLEVTAADISAAMAATGACSCTLQSWAWDWLTKLNIIEAAAFYSCPCGNTRLTDDQKTNLLTWATAQLEELRNGNIAICSGDTGKTYPAIGWAEINHTAWSELEIIEHYDQRTP